MNIDENVRKILLALLRKWKLIVLFALIGALVGYFYTANFTTLTYTSTVEFLAYAVDTENEILDSAVTSSTTSSTTSSASTRTSNTSKMNYAMKMLPTYVQIMQTNEFTNQVAQDLNDRTNASYSGSTVKNAMTIETTEETAMFKITVSTSSADLSYEIAHQLELTIPDMMTEKNQGLVNCSVEDPPVKASAAGKLGYPKKCAIAAAIGIVIAASYIILRNLLDVRIRNSEELIEKYNIPVLGSIPSFEVKGNTQRASVKTDSSKGVYGDKPEDPNAQAQAETEKGDVE